MIIGDLTIPLRHVVKRRAHIMSTLATRIGESSVPEAPVWLRNQNRKVSSALPIGIGGRDLSRTFAIVVLCAFTTFWHH
jgi:hypothetical protein